MGRSSFITAFTVQLANPKLLLFLAALLPQFLDPTRPVAPQLAVLGPIFMLSDTIIYLLLSMLAARARPLLASPRATRIVSRVSGVAMLGAAARVAWRLTVRTTCAPSCDVLSNSGLSPRSTGYRRMVKHTAAAWQGRFGTGPSAKRAAAKPKTVPWHTGFAGAQSLGYKGGAGGRECGD